MIIVNKKLIAWSRSRHYRGTYAQNTSTSLFVEDTSVLNTGTVRRFLSKYLRGKTVRKIGHEICAAVDAGYLSKDSLRWFLYLLSVQPQVRTRICFSSRPVQYYLDMMFPNARFQAAGRLDPGNTFPGSQEYHDLLELLAARSLRFPFSFEPNSEDVEVFGTNMAQSLREQKDRVLDDEESEVLYELCAWFAGLCGKGKLNERMDARRELFELLSREVNAQGGDRLFPVSREIPRPIRHFLVLLRNNGELFELSFSLENKLKERYRDHAGVVLLTQGSNTIRRLDIPIDEHKALRSKADKILDGEQDLKELLKIFTVADPDFPSALTSLISEIAHVRYPV